MNTPTVNDFQQMPWKFFPTDVVGRKPRVVGDYFKARIFGTVAQFRCTIHQDTCFFGMMVTDIQFVKVRAHQ